MYTRELKGKNLTNDTIINDVEYKSGEDQEESPILVAQRYLNIFHQMHIFNNATKEDFNRSLLEMPERVRDLMPTIPGGRILLEYIADLEETKGLKKSKKSSQIPAVQEASLQQSSAMQYAPQIAGGSVTISSDFAQSLADSLAQAFKKNNLSSGSNISELSSVLSQSLNSYASNMQQMTETMLSHNMEQFSKIQEQNIEFFNKAQSQNIAQLTQTQTQFLQQLDTQNMQMKQQTDLIASQIQSRLMQQTTESTQVPSGAQLNSQTNNSNSATVNNINIDSSAFKGITQSIKESESRRHNDFKQMIDTLRSSLTNLPKNQDIPVSAITDSVTQALRENGKQQVEAIKAFGEMLSQTIIQSQHDLAKRIGEQNNSQPIYITISKQNAQPVYVTSDDQNTAVPVTPIEKQLEPTVQPQAETDKPTESSSFIKSFSEKIAQTTSKLAQNLKPTEKNTVDQPIDFPKAPDTASDDKEKQQEKERQKQKEKEKQQEKERQKQKEKEKQQEKDRQKQKEKKAEKSKAPETNEDAFDSRQDTDVDDFLLNKNILPQTSETQDFTAFSASDPDEEDLPDALPDLSDIEDDIPLHADMPISRDVPTPEDSRFSKAEPVETKDAPTKAKETTVPQPAKAPKIKAYDDAMLKIKEALESNETVSLNDMDDAGPVSLSNEDDTDLADVFETASEGTTDVMENESPDFAKNQSTDEAFEPADEEPIADTNDDWEYVDENDKAITDADGDWEYVDENGNPITDADGDWEYVDDDQKTADIANAFNETSSAEDQPLDDAIGKAFNDQPFDNATDDLADAFAESAPQSNEPAQDDALADAFASDSPDPLASAFEDKNT